MGIEVALVLFAVGTAVSIDQSEKARRARNKSADAQKLSNQEAKASASAQAAQERRQQVRDERIRRARILQGGANTGTDGSSGEFGAIGSLASQLGSNIGYNIGQIASAERRSDFLQTAADFSNSASNFQVNAQYGSQVAGIGMSIFNSGVGQAQPAGTTPAPK